MQPATARLNGSVGDSLVAGLALMLEDIGPSSSRRDVNGVATLHNRALGISAQRHVHRTLRQLDAEAALIELRDRLALQLVALVDEGHPEREADVAAEDLGILGPGDHGARA